MHVISCNHTIKTLARTTTFRKARVTHLINQIHHLCFDENYAKHANHVILRSRVNAKLNNLFGVA